MRPGFLATFGWHRAQTACRHTVSRTVIPRANEDVCPEQVSIQPAPIRHLDEIESSAEPAVVKTSAVKMACSQCRRETGRQQHHMSKPFASVLGTDLLLQFVRKRLCNLQHFELNPSYTSSTLGNRFSRWNT